MNTDTQTDTRASDATIPSPEGRGLGASPVRRKFVVQERYRHEPNCKGWWDDPDQTPGTERTPELAAGWIARDCRDHNPHADAFEHQIIERTERVYHPASDVDRMLSLPNIPDHQQPEKTR